jgi:PAS domain S-box-containing protein
MGIRSALRRLLTHERAAMTDDRDATFRRVVEQSADVICRISGGKFSYVSPSAFEMFGWEPQQLIGTDGFWSIYEEDRSIVAGRDQSPTGCLTSRTRSLAEHRSSGDCPNADRYRL